MSHVFISYNNKDSDFAGLLMMRLESAGFKTWMDKERLRAGSDWSESIDTGITEAFALVVIMSPDAKASEYVTYEWSFALGIGISVIPVMRQKTDLHPRLNRLQYLNFTGEQPWEKLQNELAEIQEASSPNLQIPKDTPAYIRHAIAALDSANKADRTGAIDLLAEADHPVAVDALVTALSHPLRDVRFGSALVLGDRGEIRALPHLVESIPIDIVDEVEHVEEIYRDELDKLTSAFVKIGIEAEDTLLNLLDHESSVLSELATNCLAIIGSKKSLPIFESYFQENSDWLKQYCNIYIRAIHHINQDDSSAFFVSLWNDVLQFSPDQLRSDRLPHAVSSNMYDLYRATISIKSNLLIGPLIDNLSHKSDELKSYSLISLAHFTKSTLKNSIVSSIVPLLNNKHHVQSALMLTPMPDYLELSGNNTLLCDIALQILEKIGTKQARNAALQARLGNSSSTINLTYNSHAAKYAHIYTLTVAGSLGAIGRFVGCVKSMNGFLESNIGTPGSDGEVDVDLTFDRLADKHRIVIMAEQEGLNVLIGPVGRAA